MKDKLKNTVESYQISRDDLRDIPLSKDSGNENALFKKILELFLIQSEIDTLSSSASEGLNKEISLS